MLRRKHQSYDEALLPCRTVIRGIASRWSDMVMLSYANTFAGIHALSKRCIRISSKKHMDEMPWRRWEFLGLIFVATEVESLYDEVYHRYGVRSFLTQATTRLGN